MWERLDALMEQIASADEPYPIASEVGGCVLDAIIDSLPAEYVYLIWAELTDHWELKPDERAEAETLMRRAATEWLAVRHDATARERHLDRWMFEVCGYKR
jgi:transcriptional antiterminator Rof (Rho-off)